jgi:tripartite-type tricarboxylate transporter receptor subunit TctC
MVTRRAALLGLSTYMFGTSITRAQTPFYTGKQLTLLVNYAPGGPTDIEARLLAKHIAKHIDGHPAVFVQNKDGAGGLVGINFVGEVGPRDGSMFGYFTAAAWKYLLEPEKHAVDFRSFEFLGYQSGGSVYYIRSDTPPGLRMPSDIRKAHQVVIGGLAAESSKDMFMRLTLDLLGVPYKYITGYRSSVSARLAVQRGEVQLHSESSPGYLAAVEPTLVKDGTVIPLYYDPYYENGMFKAPQGLEASKIDSFPALYRRLKGAEPSGSLWDAYRTGQEIDGTMQRIIAMPPGSPLAAQAALRAALERLNEDRDYQMEALKAMQFVPRYVTGTDINSRMRKAMAVPPEIRSFVINYLRDRK